MFFKQIVQSDLGKIFDEEELSYILGKIHFGYGDGGYEPGEYIYEENERFYYIEVGDRGGIEERVESPNAEEVLYKIYSGITFREATKEAMKHMEQGKDWRRKLFSFQLDMLKRIGGVFYLKRMQEINTILEESPYNDEI